MVKISIKCCISVAEECFYLSKRLDPDEKPHYAAFHLGLPLLAKVRILESLIYKGLK